ncbi:MAG: NAD-dependent deacylase [Armatimonadota bacterium]
MKHVEPDNNELIGILQSAKRVFVFTGAGISKESGLPTFRDDDGLWKKYDPMTLATLEAFTKDPVRVWNMYLMRHRQICEAQPNPAHITLARMEEYYPEYLLSTQNVDDLHERAGSRRMVKLHGDAMQMRCMDCGRVFDLRNRSFPDEFTVETLPKCAGCDGICRPNIVWFGELVPQEPMMKSIESSANCELMLIVGTSGEVSGGYGFAQYARANGAIIVDVNPSQSNLTQYASFWISEPAGKALPELFKKATL